MKLIYSLGLIIALTPFLGIPDSWKTVIFFIAGVVIFVKAYLINRSASKIKEDDTNSSFKQNVDLIEDLDVQDDKNIENKKEVEDEF